MSANPLPPPMAHVPDYHEQSNPFCGTVSTPGSSRATHTNARIDHIPRSAIPHSSQQAADPGSNSIPHPRSSRGVYAADLPTTFGERRDVVGSSQYTSANHDRNPGRPKRAHLRNDSARDPEKDAGASSGDMSWRAGAPPARGSTNSSFTYGDDDEDEADILEERALTILICLCGPSCILSTAIVVWTILSLILTLLLEPLRLCNYRPSFRTQLLKFLDPAMKLQLRCIYSSPESTAYSLPLLLIVNLLAPFISGALAVAAWVAATFWFFSAMLGDPAGKDGHNDGKAAVLGVRRWWEQWLLRALR